MSFSDTETLIAPDGAVETTSHNEVVLVDEPIVSPITYSSSDDEFHDAEDNYSDEKANLSSIVR